MPEAQESKQKVLYRMKQFAPQLDNSSFEQLGFRLETEHSVGVGL